MNFRGLVARFNNKEEYHTGILSSNVIIPKKDIPVLLNFEGNPIGTARIQKGKRGIYATITVPDTEKFKYLKGMYGVVGGKILKRDGEKILKWKLEYIGITNYPADKNLPKLKEV